MGLMTINLLGYEASVLGSQYLVLGTWNSYGIEQLQINPGPEWAGLTITATFVTPTASTRMVVPASGLVDVPPEATAQTLTVGNPGMIVFSGVSDGVQRITTNIYYTVANHAPVEGSDPEPTPDAWAQFVAQVQQSAQQAAQSATDAAGSATQAAGSASGASESASQAAQSAEDADASAQSAAGELEKVQDAGQTALDGIASAQTTAVGAVQQAQQSAVQAVGKEGSTQTDAVNEAGQAQQTAIQQAGKTAAQQVEQTGTEETEKVTKAADEKLKEIYKVSSLLPVPTEVDAGKTVVVNPDGSGYELGDVQVDAYTKAESDARYAPIEAAIKVTDIGTGIATLSPTISWGVQGLKLYGRSWQDGTPSVENPVPIQSAGQSGTVDVTVCGKNLLNVNTMVFNGAFSMVSITDGSTARSFVMPVENMKSICVSRGKISTQFFRFMQSTYQGQVNKLTDIPVSSFLESTWKQYDNDTEASIIIDPSARLLLCYFWSTGSSYTLEDVLDVLMINAGDTAQPWQPYTAQQLPIPTPDGLPGIPVDSGGNWVDENGQQWISDVVDCQRGVRVQYLKKVLFSDLTWEKHAKSGTESARFVTVSLSDAKMSLTPGEPLVSLSNMFTAMDGNLLYNREVSAMSGYNEGGNKLFVKIVGVTELSDFLEKTKDTTLLYQLANPITTPLDSETIAAYKSLQSYPGTTNVLAPDAGIETSAVGDATQIIADINAKITALNSAAAGT